MKEDQLLEIGMLYTERFGHPIPKPVLQDLAAGLVSERALVASMQQALDSGEPIKEWAEYRPSPGSIEAKLLYQIE